MSTMNEYLSQFYGTAKVAAAPVVSDDEMQKQASVDMFCKVAAAENIDLSALPDEQVQFLYGEFVKAASEEPPAEEPKEEKKDEKKEEEDKKHAAAAAEHAEKRAASEKIAEADYLGRVIAHSFVQELGNISKEAGDKEAGMPEALKQRAAEMGKHVGEAAKKMSGKPKELAERVSRLGEGGKTVPIGHSKTRDFVASHGHHAAGAAAALGGAAAAGHHQGKKHGSAFEQVAGEQAVAFAGEQGWDTEQAGRKVASVLELGLLGESEKVASETDYQTSVGIRALEILECAGYPVTWAS